jgi:hypothetical protein
MGAVASTPQFQQLVAQHAAVQKSKQVREVTLGLRGTLPAGGAKTQICVRPQMPFRGHRLVVAKAPADAEIHEITVGHITQLGSPGPVPAKIFDPSSMGVRMQLDTCNVAQDIILTVSSNTGGEFSGALFGAAMTDGNFEPPFDTGEAAEPLIDLAEATLKYEDEKYEPGVTLEELKDAGWNVPEDE